MRFNEAKKIIDALAKVQKELDAITTIMGVEAVKFYKAGFRKQGWDDDGVEKWKERKPRMRGGKNTDEGRAILVGKRGGTLRKSIKYRRFGRLAVLVGVGGTAKRYAAVHNEGLMSGRGAGFIMPKRKFIGESNNLNRIIKKKITNRIDRLFK